VLKQDQQLLVFPLISALAALVVVVSFALPLLGLGAIDGLSHRGGSAVSMVTYVVGFLFYVSLYFVIFFFNAALVGAAMIRFDGGVPTVRDGLRVANSKFVSILGYALIAATVGMVLRAIQERVGFIGRMVVGLLGVGWTVATYLVVPVLVSRDTGPIEAIKESATILKKTWGENVVGQAGMGVAFALIHFLIVVCGIALVVAAAASGSGALIGLAVFAVVAALIFAALVQSALGGIYSAALYRYAAQGGVASNGFDSHALHMAFAPKA
jgi:hypothetical protein